MDRTFKSGQFNYILKDLCGRSLASLSPTYQCKHYVKIAIIFIFFNAASWESISSWHCLLSTFKTIIKVTVYYFICATRCKIHNECHQSRCLIVTIVLIILCSKGLTCFNITLISLDLVCFLFIISCICLSVCM